MRKKVSVIILICFIPLVVLIINKQSEMIRKVFFDLMNLGKYNFEIGVSLAVKKNFSLPPPAYTVFPPLEGTQGGL